MFDYIPPVRDFLENQWENVLLLFGHDEKYVLVLGSSLVLFTSFWMTCSFFMFLDYTGTPSCLHKYKIQKDKNIPVSKKRFFHCFAVAVRNELLSCVLIYLLYPTMRKFQVTCHNPLPPLWRVWVDFALYGILAEFIFYYSHRLFHHPALYKHIHKMHHEWIAPISMAASFAHPVEHIISNAAPLLLPPIICGSHISHTWLFFALGQFGTCLHHCNYHFPGMTSPQFHDYHHLKFTECFGTNGLLDCFHKTDVNFKDSIQFKRHKTFYGLTPICQQYPSENKKEN